jgi:hypothetical protein
MALNNLLKVAYGTGGKNAGDIILAFNEGFSKLTAGYLEGVEKVAHELGTACRKFNEKGNIAKPTLLKEIKKILKQGRKEGHIRSYKLKPKKHSAKVLIEGCELALKFP